MEDTIRKFGEQFSWQPVVEHNEALKAYKYFIIAGMGGSHLGAWLIRAYGHMPNVLVHRNYGLPSVPKDITENALVILSSYSGSTEEVLDCARECLAKGMPLAAITKGGKLLEFAREHAIPHCVIPESNLEPRMAIGYSMLGIAALMNNLKLQGDIRAAGTAINPGLGESEGTRIAGVLRGKIPLVYSSVSNLPLAYIWKIKCNETAKIPAFCNSFPEFNHNELSGFDTVDGTKSLSSSMHAVYLDDLDDHPRVKLRMQTTADVLAEKGIPVLRIPLTSSGFTKAFDAALLADWVTLSLAREYNVPNPETPLIAEFKKRIGQ